MGGIPVQGSDEQSWLARLDAESITLNERLNYFSLSSSNVPAGQIQAYINELNMFLGKFTAWRPAADRLRGEGRPAFAQRLEAIIQRIEYNLQTYHFAFNSKSAFERFQQQQGYPAGPPTSTGGAPERFQAMMGMRCYWCGQDLVGMAQPVAICPRCGRFPTPP